LKRRHKRLCLTHHDRLFRYLLAVVDSSWLRRRGDMARKLVDLRIVHGKLYFFWFGNVLTRSAQKRTNGLDTFRLRNKRL
jgi:hypothetical protein